jgi:hypothetical protein
MKTETLGIQILSENDRDYVMNVLEDLEQKHFIEIRASIFIDEKPFTVAEVNEMIEKSEKSRAFTVEEAQAFLKL